MNLPKSKSSIHVTVRRAKPGDESGIAKVHIQSWQEAYKGIVPEAYLRELPKELDERTAMWKKMFTNPQRWTFVAEASDEILGFILFGPPRDSDKENYIELGALYLLASAKGHGIGYALLCAGFHAMKDLGYQRAYCWVQDNNPTTHFYERTGAVPTGESKTDEIGGLVVNDVAYEWKHLNLTD